MEEYFLLDEMRVDFIFYNDGWEHFSSFGALIVEKQKYAKARNIIWLATTWCL
jgi:hypothetical protein